MIDMQTTRVAVLGNRVPSPIMAVEVFGPSRSDCSASTGGICAVVLAAVLVSFLILVTFDLDRPARGLIRAPDTPLVELRASMELPPAAG